jgi:hypothetical protein
MSRNTKIVAALLFVGLLAIGAILIAGASRSSAQTVQALARVVKAEREVKGGDDDTIVTLAYSMRSESVQGRARVDGVRLQEYPAGRQVVVCFDSDNPTSVRIADGPCD